MNVVGEGISQVEAGLHIRDVLWDKFENEELMKVFYEMEPIERGRAPYSMGWRDIDRGITIFANGKLNHFTIEHSGQGGR